MFSQFIPTRKYHSQQRIEHSLYARNHKVPTRGRPIPWIQQPEEEADHMSWISPNLDKRKPPMSIKNQMLLRNFWELQMNALCHFSSRCSCRVHDWAVNDGSAEKGFPKRICYRWPSKKFILRGLSFRAIRLTHPAEWSKTLTWVSTIKKYLIAQRRYRSWLSFSNASNIIRKRIEWMQKTWDIKLKYKFNS